MTNFVNTFENFEAGQEEKALTTGIDKDAIIHGRMEQTGSGAFVYDYNYHSDNNRKRRKCEAEGKKLYVVNSKDLKLEEAGKKGKQEFAYYLKPEVVETLNKMGEEIQEVIKLKKELFFSSVHNVAIGNKSAFNLK